MTAANTISPPSGQIIGIGGVESDLHLLRVVADGTLPNTEEELNPILLDVSTCQCVNIWIQLVIGSLTSYSVLPVMIDSGGSVEYRPFSWDYNTTSDVWVANAPVEFNMTINGNFMINIPVYGASFMKFRHSSDGTITSSSAIIQVSRNWNLHKYYIQDPA